jgi:hypothetical protein
MLTLFTGFAAADPARCGLGGDAETVRATFDALVARALDEPVHSGPEVFTADDIRR